MYMLFIYMHLEYMLPYIIHSCNVNTPESIFIEMRCLNDFDLIWFDLKFYVLHCLKIKICPIIVAIFFN